MAFQRWEFIPEFDFLTTLDIWVQIRGIPLPYVSDETIRAIAESLGEVIEMGFQASTATQIACFRVRIRIGINNRIRFYRRVRFQSGETTMISFRYENLRRICSNCSCITQHSSHCPFLPA